MLILFCISLEVLFCFFPSGSATQFRVMISPYWTSGSHPLDPPHSVEVLWTRDQPEAETFPWKHTTLSRESHPCSRRDSKPHSRHASDRWLTPRTARSLGSVFLLRYQDIFSYLGIYGMKRQVWRLSPHNGCVWNKENCWCGLLDNVRKSRRAGEATEGNMIHTHCPLDN